MYISYRCPYHPLAQSCNSFLDIAYYLSVAKDSPLLRKQTKDQGHRDKSKVDLRESEMCTEAFMMPWAVLRLRVTEDCYLIVLQSDIDGQR